MLYVHSIDGDIVNVINTKNGEIKPIPRGFIYQILYSGVSIVGVLNDSIVTSSTEWLEEAFFNECLSLVTMRLLNKSFSNDYERFKFLVQEFSNCYKDVFDLSLTPVISCSRWHFVADCICEYIKRNNTSCVVERQKVVYTDSICYKQVYKNTGIQILEGISVIKGYPRPVYKIKYQDL